LSEAPRRLPEVKTLYDLLPKGTEGGKEFSRVVDLLIFHEARRAGRRASLYSDAAGDYRGLDSFVGDRFRREGTTGYQYKFFPSPVSKDHRQHIADSLQRAASYEGRARGRKPIKLKKWVLVTPQDLVEPATRGDGGDVSWFESLRGRLKIDFEVEHWGHKKLLALFLETPSLCLYYYPELVRDGTPLRKTIEEIRIRYNDNLVGLYRDIQFVGMSVYKPEATKGVPMEHIYIPLTVVPEAAEERGAELGFRLNPLDFVASGQQHVILGDPGSGKSTLLRFLALAGISKPLQSRYNAKEDKRLPIFVTLRRYADELKARTNLSILDYIRESIRGDFNLKDADDRFLEYYLESGQAILLFDGMDELPGSQYKQIVRDRIRALVTTYPGNTAFVTTRIVGYENPHRFDESEFRHFRIAKLQLPEMEQFVRDWYAARIENEAEREQNVNDLVRILRDDTHTAIRDLAENPLLLTIVALVHRIDAVLPDERVVLYQKCTETLLNTWHTWKFRGSETPNRGKVERRNRYRMEAIAHWMQSQSTSTDKTKRAVVSYQDLCAFLTRHIAGNEKASEPEIEPQDLASNFLEFVKNRAGLLIEVGDQKFSFVHLTFQEYLTSSYIITVTETQGAAGLWATIKDHCADARWHEVIRLLVAGLKSNDSQRLAINKLLSKSGKQPGLAKAQLLGGLLVDGIEPAQERAGEILSHLILSGCHAETTEELRPIATTLKSWAAKTQSNTEVLRITFEKSKRRARVAQSGMTLALLAAAADLQTVVADVTEKQLLPRIDKQCASFKFFFNPSPSDRVLHLMRDAIRRYTELQHVYSLFSPEHNFVAAAAQTIGSKLPVIQFARMAFEQQMVALATQHTGPFSDFIYNQVLISVSSTSSLYGAITSPTNIRQKYAGEFQLKLEKARARVETKRRTTKRETSNESLNPAQRLAFEKLAARGHNRLTKSELPRRHIEDLQRARDVASQNPDARGTPNVFWREVLNSVGLHGSILDFICDAFKLVPGTHWWEALRVAFLPGMPEKNRLFDESLWTTTEESLLSNNFTDAEIYIAAWLTLLDVWIHVHEVRRSIGLPITAVLDRIADQAKRIDAAPAAVSTCIRDIAFGNVERIGDLVSMMRSDEPDFRRLFETCLWVSPSRYMS
jgi:hypothetical protein